MTTESLTQPSNLAPEELPREPEKRSGQSRSSGPNLKAVLWILGALLIAVPTVNLPNSGPWLIVKAFAMEAVGIALAVFVVSRGDWTRERVRTAVAAAPNVAILAFILWVALSALRSDLPRFSQVEAMRHLGGVLVYFSVVYGLSVRRHLGNVLTVLLIAGTLASVLAFLNYAETDARRIVGAFRDEQLFSAFLGVLLPVLLMASRIDEETWRRFAAQAVAVIVVAAILVTRNRSVWAASIVALVVMGLLYLKYGRAATRVTVQKHQIVIPALAVLLSLGLFFQISRVGGGLDQRVQTVKALNRDDSFQWRLGMWNKALQMAIDRPVFGYGVGTFPLQQALYFHKNAPSRSQRSIYQKGASLSENAHNTYFQIAAELGFVGLVLYLSIFGAFFYTALRAMRRQRKGFRHSILIACTAAVVAQMVSAVGSPAWEFAECSLFLWLMLGLGMAAAGVGERGRDPSSSGRPA
jgi:O-antigen ligase